MDEQPKSRARHLADSVLGKVDDRVWSVLDELAWNQDNLYRHLETLQVRIAQLEAEKVKP